MFFGITNNSTMFQTMMNDIFQNLIVDENMIVYLDNILIFTQTLEDYQKTMCKIFKVLAKHKLFLYFKKYKFDKQ